MDKPLPAQIFRVLSLNAKFSDVVFIFNDEQKVSAQKCVLATGSSVFSEMFFGRLPQLRSESRTHQPTALKNSCNFFILPKLH